MAKKTKNEKFGEILYLRTNFDEETVRRTLAEQFGFKPAEITRAIKEADRYISEAGAPDIAAEAGLLLTRNEQLYKKAFQAGKAEAAAQLQRDRLAILTRLQTQSAEGEAQSADAELLTEQIETARQYLESIEGTRKGLPIEDLAREVLTRFIEMEKCRLKDAQE